jgi:hypothetical protein
MEAKMGEVIQFISKAERERLRLIREARAIYDGVFPPSESISEQPDEKRATRTGTETDARRGEALQ